MFSFTEMLNKLYHLRSHDCFGLGIYESLLLHQLLVTDMDQGPIWPVYLLSQFKFDGNFSLFSSEFQ